MPQYYETNCILCRTTQIAAMPNVICNDCADTSAPVDEIMSLRARMEELLAALESINQNGGVTWDYATIGNVARAAIAKEQ
jgi:hypothetical protein